LAAQNPHPACKHWVQWLEGSKARLESHTKGADELSREKLMGGESFEVTWKAAVRTTRATMTPLKLTNKSRRLPQRSISIIPANRSPI